MHNLFGCFFSTFESKCLLLFLPLKLKTKLVIKDFSKEKNIMHNS
jgi:hypothetical protein